MVDYYKILEIQSTSSLSEIKRAYRLLALRYHPDQNKSFEARMKFHELTEAYEVLKVEGKRAIYDRAYNLHFKQNEDLVHNPTEFAKHHEEWRNQAHEAANRYSKMDITSFSKLIIGEILTFIRFIPILILAIILILLLFVGYPTLLTSDLVEKEPSIILIALIGMGGVILVFLKFIIPLFRQYQEERNELRE